MEFKRLCKRLVHQTHEAIEHYGMIEPGERWLIGLVGQQRQPYAAGGPARVEMARSVAGLAFGL